MGKRLEWQSRQPKPYQTWQKTVHQEIGVSLSPKYNCLPDCDLKSKDFTRFVAAWEEEKNLVSGLEASDYRGAKKVNYDLREGAQMKDANGFDPEWNVMKGKRDPATLPEAGMEGSLFSGMGNNRNMFFNVKKPGD